MIRRFVGNQQAGTSHNPLNSSAHAGDGRCRTTWLAASVPKTIASDVTAGITATRLGTVPVRARPEKFGFLEV
jgi:hypothetical protein